MCQKRKELAELILANCDNKLNPLNNNGLKEWVNQIPETEKRELTEQEIIEIAIIKNKFEAITYQFEILGYYYYKNIYSRKDIYELFSYELQRYWLLVRELGFIKYLRDEKKGGEKDFYDKFEKLYKKTLNKEAFLKTKLKLWKFCEIRNSLEQEKIKKIGLFLIEEMNIS